MSWRYKVHPWPKKVYISAHARELWTMALLLSFEIYLDKVQTTSLPNSRVPVVQFKIIEQIIIWFSDAYNNAVTLQFFDISYLLD